MLNDNSAVACDSHGQIKDAELAYFKIQDTLKTCNAVDRPRVSRPTSYRSLQPILEQRRSEQAGQMELDFTISGSQGKLGCPFASTPTPRTSRSHSEVGGLGRRSKRASFHDPLSDNAKSRIAASSVVSIESDAPACPIRFLDQHSPEDIAKYFEEHKHELPRSHEVCVKRFQSNAESIKELDAKYGNLVNMIQGLGQKHQPMLPENPVLEDDAEDTKSHQNIENWAKTVVVDDSTGTEAGAHALLAPLETSVDDEERVQRFDRPMKEIRVGESPSRPWGVPIPARYLDRTTSFADSIARAPQGMSAPVRPAESMVIHADSGIVKDSKPAGGETNVDPVAERPKGKCPFDHLAMRAKNSGEQTKQPAVDDSPRSDTIAVLETKQEPIMMPKETGRELSNAAQLSHAHAHVESAHSSPLKADGEDQDTSSTIINHGVAVVHNLNSMARHKHKLVNHGTLIIGYEEADLRDVLARVTGP